MALGRDKKNERRDRWDVVVGGTVQLKHASPSEHEDDSTSANPRISNYDNHALLPKLRRGRRGPPLGPDRKTSLSLSLRDRGKGARAASVEAGKRRLGWIFQRGKASVAGGNGNSENRGARGPKGEGDETHTRTTTSGGRN